MRLIKREIEDNVRRNVYDEVFPLCQVMYDEGNVFDILYDDDPTTSIRVVMVYSE